VTSLAPVSPLRLLFWESTARCNLACAHCRRIETDAAGDLSTAQARSLIDQLAQIGKEQGLAPVLVFSGGEPLMRSDIFDLIAYAKSVSIVPALATNGTLVDDAVARRIKDSGVARVSVSIDGATAATHDGIRCQAGSFDKALAGLASLRRAGLPFQLNFTLTRANAGDVAAVHSLAQSLGAEALHVFILVPVGCGRELAGTDVLSPDEYEARLIEIASLAAKGPLQIKVTCGPHYERIRRQLGMADVGGQRGHPSKGCLAGLSVLFVSHTGTVFPCGYLPIDCGNILETPLRDIREKSPILASLRDTSLLKGKCGLCGYKVVCGGCRARAYAATGDALGEEPSCAYIPGGKGESV
jgi:radical SAM protein with 4Fe4S-binding SPASM domain